MTEALAWLNGQLAERELAPLAALPPTPLALEESLPADWQLRDLHLWVREYPGATQTPLPKALAEWVCTHRHGRPNPST